VKHNALEGSVESLFAIRQGEGVPCDCTNARQRDKSLAWSSRPDLPSPKSSIEPSGVGASLTGRRARVIELNPIFVDVSIERWQRLTGGTAVHAETGQPFPRTGNVPAADIGG